MNIRQHRVVKDLWMDCDGKDHPMFGEQAIQSTGDLKPVRIGYEHRVVLIVEEPKYDDIRVQP